MSNTSEWLVAETLTKSGTLSSIGVEKRSSKGGGDKPHFAVTNSELPQEYPICDFARRSPENPDSLYLNVVHNTPFTNITITKKVYFCNYNKNDEDNKDKWEVDNDGDVGPFFYIISDEKDFEYDRYNPVSMGGEVNVEVEYQDGKCILLYYENIYAMNKDYMYAEIFQRGTKEKKSTNNKYLK